MCWFDDANGLLCGESWCVVRGQSTMKVGVEDHNRKRIWKDDAETYIARGECGGVLEVEGLCVCLKQQIEGLRCKGLE